MRKNNRRIDLKKQTSRIVVVLRRSILRLLYNELFSERTEGFFVERVFVCTYDFILQLNKYIPIPTV